MVRSSEAWICVHEHAGSAKPVPKHLHLEKLGQDPFDLERGDSSIEPIFWKLLAKRTWPNFVQGRFGLGLDTPSLLRLDIRGSHMLDGAGELIIKQLIGISH